MPRSAARSRREICRHSGSRATEFATGAACPGSEPPDVRPAPTFAPYDLSMRLLADADPARWIAVTGSLGLRGRRHRKAAIRMLLGQAGAAFGAPSTGPATGPSTRPGSGFGAWALSQAAPFLMRKADGRVLVWTWKAEPELIVAMATAQELTPQVRAARAMMPMEYDDTEEFRNPYLGSGEKLVVPLPPSNASGQGSAPPFATYTWDTGTHLITLQAVCADRERFGTVIAAVDEIARTLRTADDLSVGESGPVLRLPPA